MEAFLLIQDRVVGDMEGQFKNIKWSQQRVHKNDNIFPFDSQISYYNSLGFEYHITFK